MRRLVPLVHLGLLAAFGAGLLVLGDRLLGRVVDPAFTPLRGAPETTTVLARPEFRVRVRTNAEGFRGPALPDAKRAGVLRIVVLGDSFTWGYGVRERQAYPARLERRLRAHGVPAEVVNLGLPGTGPLDYAHHLEHAGLALAPDLVVVGVFANDLNDVYQLERFGARSPLFALGEIGRDGLALQSWWRRTMAAAVPTVYALASRARARLASGPREARAAETSAARGASRDPEAVLAALGTRYGRRDAVLARYRALAPADRTAVDGLLAGRPLGADVRPAVLLAALVDPEAELDGLLVRSPDRRAAFAAVDAALTRIVRRARAAGADTVLAVLPASEQVDRSRWPFLAAAGFALDPALLDEAWLADRVHAVATREGAGFVDLVRAFRTRRDAGLYFVVDEHWNGRGHAFAAARLAAAIVPRVDGGPPAS